MLLIRPDEEQSVRNRIALMREMMADGPLDNELTGWKEGLEKLEKQLTEMEKSAEFKRIRDDYWSKNEVQLAAMGSLLGELGTEVERLARGVAEADKVKKGAFAGDLEKRRAEFFEISKQALEFVPYGAKTGELVRKALESWERMKGAKTMIGILNEFNETFEDRALPAYKKLDAEEKRLNRLKADMRGNKALLKDVEAQATKVEELRKQDSSFKADLRARKKRIFDLQSSIPDLNAQFAKSIKELSAMAGSSVLTDGSGKPLREIMLAYSIPHVRAAVEAAASAIPRGSLARRHESAAADYEEAKDGFEKAAIKAKSRARCKRCREMGEALLSGAVDQNAKEVRLCAGILEEGDIFEAKKALDAAFISGNMHEYAREELSKMMKEMLAIYDQKGEVSIAERKLLEAGDKLLRARLDIMRLDYILGGVHSPNRIWLAASEALEWLEEAGLKFGEGVKQEIAEGKGKIEFMGITDNRGFTKEQTEGAESLGVSLGAEAEIREKLAGSNAASELEHLEAQMASTVSATQNFENPLFVKSLLSGSEKALAIMKRALEDAGGRAEEIESYMDAALKQEILKGLGDDVGGISKGLEKMRELCAEIGKLKAGSLKQDSGAISQKIALGRKAAELVGIIEEISGSRADDAFTEKINDPKLSGEKLFIELVSSQIVSGAIKRRLAEHAKALGEITELEEMAEGKTSVKPSAS